MDFKRKDNPMTEPILEMRVAFTTEDYDRLAAFYQQALGLEPGAIWTNAGRGILFELGRATVEVFDEAQAAYVDELEMGQRVSGPIRLALRVPDLDAAIDRLEKHGVKLLHEPVLTPWNDRNARMQTPDGLQVTLFQTM
jgi:lactoylglutathione lyase